MSITVRVLSNPTANEIEECTNVLHEAFNHQYFIWGLENNESLVKSCLRVHLMAGFIGGEVHVAELEGRISGVAMWFGPGKMFLSTAEQRSGGWDDLLSNLGDVCQEYWSYILKVLFDAPEKYYGPGVKLDSYHLQTLGVHPSYQKKGAGTALLNFVEKTASSESKSVVLETLGTSAVPFYQKHGYTVYGPDDIKIVGSDNTLPGFWFQKKF